MLNWDGKLAPANARISQGSMQTKTMSYTEDNVTAALAVNGDAHNDRSSVRLPSSEMPLHDLRGWGAVGAAVGGDLAGLANHYDVQQAQACVEHPQQGLHTNNQHSESPSTRARRRCASWLRSCQPTVAQVEGPKLGRRQQSHHVKYGLQQPPARHTGNGREDGGVHDIDEADKRGEEERHVEQTHGLPQAVLQLRDVEVDQGKQLG
eukprot:CAMPEP_0177443020 /NCGR_PEP_ID=MMETSP0369-20130122/5247_1 /TAXON_ID=447022 ORGANISM="Scrippsiella hangoei-like, Strain SHHI-4" /NCGR_SAMPLE_ID=MMETSP0369 /ASSEMBLY_ACC=CAM_ASM_000364 /LENGTH=206 /DNA_ID=CAMNT_0018914989 /DNA_START=272 /DNA_END=891 /DNA_ORIENTATION=-